MRRLAPRADRAAAAPPSGADAGPGRPPLALLLLGLYTGLHAAAVLGLAAAPWVVGAPLALVPAALALLYLVPPLVARLLLRWWGVPAARGTPDPRGLRRWWALSQLQMVFNRLPVLEEGLRLVPGLYSAWLRLWGARIGRYVFWSPGVLVADRYCLVVGDRACLGVGAKLLPHVLVPAGPAGLGLLLAPIVVGAGAFVGGFTVLGPGTRVAAGETFPACTVLPPFWVWEGGRRAPGRTADPHAARAATARGTRGHAC